MTTVESNRDAGRARVLIVDDSSLVRLYYRETLEGAGFEVEQAINGIEAMEKVLAEPFARLRATGLDDHVPTMCDFWKTVLFRAGRYRGSALQAHRDIHRRAPLSDRHFRRWLTLWHITVDEMYRGPAADRADAGSDGSLLPHDGNPAAGRPRVQRRRCEPIETGHHRQPDAGPAILAGPAGPGSGPRKRPGVGST